MDQSPELKFCRLCGKNKPADKFEPIPLFEFEGKLFIQLACELCRVVVHNVRQIYRDETNRIKDAEQKTAQEKLASQVHLSGLPDKGKRIVVPFLKTPKNLRS